MAEAWHALGVTVPEGHWGMAVVKQPCRFCHLGSEQLCVPVGAENRVVHPMGCCSIAGNTKIDLMAALVSLYVYPAPNRG